MDKIFENEFRPCAERKAVHEAKHAEYLRKVAAAEVVHNEKMTAHVELWTQCTLDAVDPKDDICFAAFTSRLIVESLVEELTALGYFCQVSTARKPIKSFVQMIGEMVEITFKPIDLTVSMVPPPAPAKKTPRAPPLSKLGMM